MPSKSYHKYDVEDYYNIDPDFGTLDDFDKLIEECHKRGINVILDLVLNHASSKNPLFTKAEFGVDGFRLDACKYFTNKETDGTEFLKWFYDTCKGIKEDVYMVGENWTDDSDIQELYKSGIDSQFAFKFSTSTGTIISNIISQGGMATVSRSLYACAW